MWGKYTIFWDIQGIGKDWYTGFTNVPIVGVQA